EERLACHRFVTLLSPRYLRRCERAGGKCKKSPTILHDRLLPSSLGMIFSENRFTLFRIMPFHEAIPQHSTTKIRQGLGQSVTSGRLRRDRAYASYEVRDWKCSVLSSPEPGCW